MKIVTQKQPQLFQESSDSSFFTISPYDPHGLEKATEIDEKNYPREKLADILMEYNISIGNDALALQNIKRLAQPESHCVITGQQLGFMGGPSYTILKGISCVQLARDADAIPVFWLATEDHDIGEIDHTFLVDSFGNLKKFHLLLPKRGISVEDLELTEGHFEIINQFLNDVKAAHLFSKPKKSILYSRWMVQFLVKMFAGTGIVFVEPYLLRNLAVSFFKREVLERVSIQRVLQKTTQKMKDAGIDPSLHLENDTNLFIKTEENHRNKLIVGSSFSEKELLELIDQEPERFSTNVAARPVLQSLLFPTLAYVAGPSELAYFQQLGDYHRYHGISMPWIVPRLSATILSLHAQELLKEEKLSPWDLLPSKGEGVHYLRNYLHPHGKLQERILNWWQFQGASRENLIQEMIGQTDWRTSKGHLYCYL